MKKIVMLLALLAFGMLVSAQSYTLYGKTGQTYFKSTTDVTITNTTAVWVQINIDVDFPVGVKCVPVCDSVSGNHTAIALAVYGRAFEGGAWVDLSGTSTGQGVDHTIAMDYYQYTEVRYRQFKILLTGTGTGVSKLDQLEFKVYSPD